MINKIETKEQFSRAKKRLQRSLLAHKIELSLSQCGEILSNILGVRNTHELNKSLSENKSNDFNILMAANKLFEILSSFKLAQSEKLEWFFSKFNITSSLALNITGPSAKFNDIEGFGIFFDSSSDPLNYIDKELSNLNLSKDTVQLLKQIVTIIHETPAIYREPLGFECLKLCGVWNGTDEHLKEFIFSESTHPLLHKLKSKKLLKQ